MSELLPPKTPVAQAVKQGHVGRLGARLAHGSVDDVAVSGGAALRASQGLGGFKRDNAGLCAGGCSDGGGKQQGLGNSLIHLGIPSN